MSTAEELDAKIKRACDEIEECWRVEMESEKERERTPSWRIFKRDRLTQMERLAYHRRKDLELAIMGWGFVRGHSR